MKPLSDDELIGLGRRARIPWELMDEASCKSVIALVEEVIERRAGEKVVEKERDEARLLAINLTSKGLAAYDPPGLMREIVALRERVAVLELELADARALSDKSYCVYCGHVGEKNSEAMIAHVMECAKHPMGAAVRRIEELEGALASALAASGGDHTEWCDLILDGKACDCWMPAARAAISGAATDQK